MILIYAIIFGILLYVLDFVLGKLSKQKFSIIGSIESFIDNISGESVWVRLLIVLGTPFLSFYLSNTFLENSLGFWVFTIIGVISIGYLGISWLETSSFSAPTPKAIMLFIIGVGLWILGDQTGMGLEFGSTDVSNDIFIILGWIFIVGAVIVYWRRKSHKIK